MILEALGFIFILGVTAAASYGVGRKRADAELADWAARSWRPAYLQGRREGADFRRRFE